MSGYCDCGLVLMLGKPCRIVKQLDQTGVHRPPGSGDPVCYIETDGALHWLPPFTTAEGRP